VEIYFYHKEEVPSDEEEPAPRKNKKKNNPELEAIQQKDLEELRQESREQFEAMCMQTFDDMRDIISTIIDRDRESTVNVKKSKFPLSETDELALSEELPTRRQLSLRKFGHTDPHSELLTPFSKLVPSPIDESRRPKSASKWWPVQRVLF